MHSSINTYRNIVIEASSAETEIWLGDDEGHLVQMEVGVLSTDVLEGNYTVEFGLGTTTYPIHLTTDLRYTETQLKNGPSCPKPKVNLEKFGLGPKQSS